ncbi:MAG: hydrolase [Rhodocyclales bacterium CG17_big_fil_post_rev_8_21_14_2_50_68_7]|nr:MAG: hydrolase [Betaproteobacteria bacterium CG2_30_68_42]PIV71584.1 MAG: hydrolase [Rhodocyclales bacterium CG17_big_fil_post_rev_8_21_14_2_50_68_7]PIX76061.1 MAG: hydrolase [Rhodocyclales bacterium CG_4_10_14_3_um_filter_68_10]PJA58583.1 MAG: hydrolase [Rhodocyclales bacterium CG_4_9_14_3_um_filter_68_10]
MLLDRARSALLAVDFQERLLPHIEDWQRVLDAAVWLVRLAQRLSVPVMVSEQYPKGLGPTHAALRALVPAQAVREKLHFSCVAAGCLEGLDGAQREQLVVCGIEAHVCVLQTVLDLLGPGREVFVVADAVSSRRIGDREAALARMRANGATIVTREMVAFEWLHKAGSAEFREISAEFLR